MADPIDHDAIATLWDVLAWHADARPDAVALQFEGQKTRYGALFDRSRRLRDRLIAEGIGHGDRIAYLGKNNDRYFALLYAIAGAGAVLVPLNWRLAAEEWRFIIEDAGVIRLFTDRDFATEASTLASTICLPAPERIDAIAFDDFSSVAMPDLPLSAEDTVLQIYTSGTTGRPKGALLSHRNMLALRAPGYRADLAWFPRERDTSLGILPIAHIAGTAYALFGLYGGGRVVLTREFDAGETIALIREERITHILLAAAVMRMLLDHPACDPMAFESLAFITYGASPIPEALLRRAIPIFGCGFVQMYGMTEASGGIVALAPDDHVRDDGAYLLSAGRAMPGADIMVADDRGVALPPDMIGEVMVRSGAVMAGYWRQPEATAAAFSPEGWLRTGDIGRIDPQGYLFVLDRVKDMIISGGENVYPAEVENAIFGHPDVADIAVIGIPSETWGEAVAAIVVPRPGHTIDPEAIRGWARARIAAFKVPRHIEVRADLPRNAGGKVLRRLLRAPFWPDADS